MIPIRVNSTVPHCWTGWNPIKSFHSCPHTLQNALGLYPPSTWRDQRLFIPLYLFIIALFHPANFRCSVSMFDILSVQKLVPPMGNSFFSLVPMWSKLHWHPDWRPNTYLGFLCGCVQVIRSHNRLMMCMTVWRCISKISSLSLIHTKSVHKLRPVTLACDGLCILLASVLYSCFT